MLQLWKLADSGRASFSISSKIKERDSYKSLAGGVAQYHHTRHSECSSVKEIVALVMDEVWRCAVDDDRYDHRWSVERRKVLLLLSTTNKPIRGEVLGRSAAFQKAAVGSGNGRTLLAHGTKNPAPYTVARKVGLF